MCFFNDANALAYQAVYGRHYQGDEPCERPEGVTAQDGVLAGVLRVEGTEIDLTGMRVEHQTWANLATAVQEAAINGDTERDERSADIDMVKPF